MVRCSICIPARSDFSHIQINKKLPNEISAVFVTVCGKIELRGKNAIHAALDVLAGQQTQEEVLANFSESPHETSTEQYPFLKLFLRYFNARDKQFLNPDFVLNCRIFLESDAYTKDACIEAENTFFESKLALTLACTLELFPVINKASLQILKLIDQEESRIRELLADKTNFTYLINELYRDNKRGALGAIEKPDTEITIDSLLADIRRVLTNEVLLINIMPIHNVFSYRIMRLLYPQEYANIKNNYKSVVDFVAHGKKFVIAKNKDEAIPLISQLGLATDPKICGIINRLDEAVVLSQLINTHHRNSSQRFWVDELDLRRILPNINHMPLRAGPSAHAIAICTALTINSLILKQAEPTQEEYMEYALAYFAYLGSAGYHSFWEVMKVASMCANVPFYDGQYVVNLPIKVQKFIESWSNQFLLSQESKKAMQLCSLVASPRFFGNDFYPNPINLSPHYANGARKF